MVTHRVAHHEGRKQDPRSTVIKAYGISNGIHTSDGGPVCYSSILLFNQKRAALEAKRRPAKILFITVNAKMGKASFKYNSPKSWQA